MFITEKQLVNKLKSNFSQICNWDSVKYFTKVSEEVNLGFGVADLVISKINLKNASKKNITLNYFDIVIYKIVESNQVISFEKIKEITKANDLVIRKSLSKLMVSCYINNHDSLFQFSKSYQTIITDLIAIEAKLKNWKRALEQAFRYKWFAKKAFVVLDSINIQPAIKNITQFERLNVGLAEINKQGKVIIHFKPLKNQPIDEKMWILFNEEIKKSFLRNKK